jgi:hypothetical protein
MFGPIKMAFAAAMLLIASSPSNAQQAPVKMTLFGQPSVNNDSIRTAFEKGFCYKAEGLDSSAT